VVTKKKATISLHVHQQQQKTGVSLSELFLSIAKSPTWIGSDQSTPLLEIADIDSSNEIGQRYLVSLSWGIREEEDANFFLFVPRFIDRVKYELPLFCELVAATWVIEKASTIEAL
jgi:hypothetical protein